MVWLSVCIYGSQEMKLVGTGKMVRYLVQLILNRSYRDYRAIYARHGYSMSEGVVMLCCNVG